ncbi:hypothetical protein [uncultured Bacteroides sp.]|uniref:hypothetical protein n=2 Tax=Bacteroides congonensis TaxID=1871006 RepID=UPI0027DAF3ED|nr:hypothetical protein [uncultured Bacteroides sp.]
MNKYEGMTVNERLYVSGLIDEFYKAVEKKDIEAVISILKKVELSNNQIKPILTALSLPYILIA